MELEFRFRNNDLGPHFPTFQERSTPCCPSNRRNRIRAASSAAPALEENAPSTPHILNSEEVQQTLAQVEEEAAQQSRELIEVHSGLNEQRVARLLGLLG